MQLDFDFSAAAKPSTTPTTTESLDREANQCDRILRYVRGGWDGTWPLTMKVWQFNALWDDLWSRAEAAATKLGAFADACEKRCKGNSRLEKQRLLALAEDSRAMAELAASLPEWLWMEAQENFAAQHQFDDETSEEFWSAIGQRPGIESTWQMSLAEVLAEIQTEVAEAA